MRLGQGVLLLLCVFTETLYLAGGSKPPLYILVLSPFPDSGPGFDIRYTGPGGPGIIPLVNLSVQQINSRDDVLGDYDLKFISANSGCAVESIATESLVRHVYVRDDYSSLTPVVGVIGSVCSTASTAVASLLARDKGSLLQFTIATSPVLSTYDNTIRPLGTSMDFVEVFLKLMEINKWTRVGTLYESDRVFFSETNSAFHEEIHTSTNYSILPSSISDTHINLSPFMTTLTRVIVVFAASDLTRKIICMAHQKHLDLTYPSYQFFFHEKNIQHLKNATKFKLEGTLYDCSREEMIESLHGSIISNIRLNRREDDTTRSIRLKSKLTFGEHLEWLYGLNISIDRNANIFYDGVWSFALALNKLAPKYNLSNYRYGQQNTTDLIRQEFAALDFEGASGRISFSDTLDGKPLLDFNFSRLNEETHDIEEVVVAVYNTSESAFTLDPNDNFFFIEDDSFTVNKVHIYIGIVMSVVILAIFLLTASLHFLNLIYRENKTFKATSPTLNNLMFSGCYLFIVAAVAVCIEGPFYFNELSTVIYSVSCSVISWCVPMGYSLVFGTICVKTFRIYRIFTGMKRHGVFLNDQFLTLCVVAILFYDIVINVIWNEVDPWTVNAGSTIRGGRLLVEPYCRCKHFVIWAALLGLSKLLLTVIVIFLSILTRHVDREEFKYTKNINILAYALALVYCVGVPIAALFTASNPYIRFFSLCLTFLSSVILCQITLFLPPLVPILFRKKQQHGVAELVKVLTKE